jgi:3-hydroxy-D-aspartate aldolase
MTPAMQALFPDVDTPALMLDSTQVRKNIALLQSRADAAGIRLRPHVKAHKSSHIARLQMEAGAVGLCCTKLGEAEVMVANGHRDLLITSPVVGMLKIERLLQLGRAASIQVVADDELNIRELASAARAAGVDIGIVIEVDVGQGRCGVQPGPRAAELARHVISSGALTLAGVQGYQGGLQCTPLFSERSIGVRAAMDRLAMSLEELRRAGITVPVITGGGTGSFPIDIELHQLTELQPGSYVTMDATYTATEWSAAGSGPPLGQPLTVLASVVSRPTRDKAIVDAGWKAVSSDAGVPRVKDRPDLRFEFAGDEHGAIVAMTGKLGLNVGDRVELIPSHCDTTVNLYDKFVVHHAGRAEAIWPIEARGKSQ